MKQLIILIAIACCTTAAAQNDSIPKDSIQWQKQLDEVTVVHQKKLVKMETDKMTYKVSQDEDSKTATVLDMLRKVPMVTVDGQDNISVNGSSSFQIYVDGKPNPMISANASVVLKSMPATAVKDIEVVTNPGAKYDAEGAGGILNLIMNKQSGVSLDGYNGTIRAMASTTNTGLGAFLSGQKGKLSYSANANYSQMKPGTTKMETTRTADDGSTMLSNITSKTKIPFVMGSFSLGYELDPMSSVNASASVTSFQMKNNGYSLMNMAGGTYGSGFSYGYDMDMKSRRTSFSGSLDYQRFLNEERTSQVSITYLLSLSPTKTEQSNEPESNLQSAIDLTTETSNNIGLVYNFYTPKLMVSAKLNQNFHNDGIQQYSFFQNGVLHTTYGNIVESSETGLNVFANWLLHKNTRIFLNGGIAYNHMKSDELNASNHGWEGNAMVGLQQTLPLDLKLSTYLITSTKTYTLQGWTSSFNLLTASLTKSFFNDKLSVGVMATTGLTKGGKLSLETYSRGADFTNHSKISVPIQNVGINISYNFGNSKRQAKMHVSKVESDFIEQQSQGEMINSVGGGGQGQGQGQQQQMPY